MDHRTDLPRLIQALRKSPASDAGATAVQPLELVETHISWVLLSSEFAYKIKKPLKLPFLNFSTLALRKQFCEDELRLNQRLAPDIYLAVLPIRQTPQGPQWGGTSGTVVEYAVQMRRFDEAGRLDRVCARGALSAAHLSDLAGTLVAFHDKAAVAPADSRFGTAAEILAPARDNFHDLAQLMPDAALQQRLATLRSWTEAQHQLLAPLMQTRKLAGRVRECHGDLHLANMVLIDARVRPFDCLEFNEDLRWIDVANEIAFTYVDLLDHGQSGLANWFVDEVLSRSGDYEGAQLLTFYAVYRAMVRAKVAAIRAGQQHDERCPQTSGAQRQDEQPAQTSPQRQRLADAASLDEALVYIAQAERLVKPQPPRLIITHGLAGCGKTFASNHLLQHDAQARTVRLRSDVERRRLFGLARSQRSGAAIDTGIYNLDAHQRTYAHLQDTAAMLLRAGWSVIVDAAFLRRAERDAFHALADAHDAGFAILAPQADIGELRRRISARQASASDASEATLAVLDKQLQWIEPLGGDETALVLEPAPISNKP